MTNGFDIMPEQLPDGYVKVPDGWTGKQALDVLEYWPRWSDGTPCMFGDEFTFYPKYSLKRTFEVLDKLTIFGPNHVWYRGLENERLHDDGYYEWNHTRPGGDGCESYRPEKRVDEPEVDILMELVEKVKGRPGNEDDRAACREVVRWMKGEDE